MTPYEIEKRKKSVESPPKRSNFGVSFQYVFGTESANKDTNQKCLVSVCLTYPQSFYHNFKITLNSPNIKLGWIKAHVGHADNKAGDLFAKTATLKGIPTQYPSSRRLLKKKFHAISTQLWQNEWDNGDTGRNVYLILPKFKTSPAPWQRPEIMFATGHVPFPIYFKRFGLRTTDCCGSGELGNPLHFATSYSPRSSDNFT
ncbi:hypothetical protein AVEN_245503-1 [Araneus ventricosus]|uniref:RNase H type-1 domain-containing protein n=1 Tax=Araneus ventricosus TaxID=182803 RepID=A0A4Y2U3M6_ARAVE|nr:hypothetical protein AVEN_245503-1 [Araneus ventricosus]